MGHLGTARTDSACQHAVPRPVVLGCAPLDPFDPLDPLASRGHRPDRIAQRCTRLTACHGTMGDDERARNAIWAIAQQKELNATQPTHELVVAGRGLEAGGIVGSWNGGCARASGRASE